MPALTLLFAASMGLAGFLIFQVQPMLAKFILPWFGGSATTWTVCMLFFQLALLAGYAYAFWLSDTFSLKRQAMIQIGVLAIGLLFLPVTPSEAFKPDGPDNPIGRIALILSAAVAGPYIILATTSTLLQRWLSRIAPAMNVSRLFAVSNLGSFLGLLSYPFVFEPFIASEDQTRFWSYGFAAYALLFGLCAAAVLRADASEAAPPGELTEGPSPIASWILWPALASVLLLATTNQITQWTAVVPFLWILPLSLYLLSFVIVFGIQGFYRRLPFFLVFAAGAALAWYFSRPASASDFLTQLALQSITLFAGCMICHGEAVRLQPGADRLARFYLSLAIGGALGGLVVTFAAPVIFSDYWEQMLALLLIAGGAGYYTMKESHGARRLAVAAGALVFCSGLALALFEEISEGTRVVDRVRNFYGVVKILNEDAQDPKAFSRVMHQAGVDQGSQFQDADRRRDAGCAFDAASGVGLALAHHKKRREGRAETPLHVGVIGLGAGMVAAHAKPGDTWRYYELNPAVRMLEQKYFTFLKDSPAKIDVLLGDGRIVLERAFKQTGSQQFDVIVLNAFRGAAPPMHLMTREAFKIYLDHLRPEGLLVINFELDTFEMAPLHRGLAKSFGLNAMWFETKVTDGCDEPVSWAVHTRDQAFFDSPEVKRAASTWRDGLDTTLLWTDKSANLMSIINW